MPAEVSDIDRFVQLSEKAEYCALKKKKSIAKFKLRAPRMLYTLKVDVAKADEIVKKLKCEIREI